MTDLYIVRHGETEENVRAILQGHLPGHLTQKGREQAAELREQLLHEGYMFDVLLAANLKRTLDTADILNQAFGLTIRPCSLLRERDWGSYTGRLIAEVDREHMPSDSESVEHMFRRAGLFLRYVVQHFPEKRVLAVTHGLFGRCLQATLQGCTIREIPRMQNAEIRHLALPSALHLETDTENVVSAD